MTEKSRKARHYEVIELERDPSQAVQTSLLLANSVRFYIPSPA